MKTLKNFWTDESGQGLTEYASIVALVSVALVLVLVAFRNELGRIYNAMRGELNELQERVDFAERMLANPARPGEKPFPTESGGTP